MKKKLIIWVLLSVLVTPAIAKTMSLPFIADNYGKALEEAKQRKLPIFVEVWAPW
jgi:hypothetical protein